MSDAARTRLLLVLAAAACIAVYWVGLSGPFVFDDGPNFAILKRWQAGEVPLASVVFGGTSLLTSRSLAMASFALNTEVFGLHPANFKAVNLGLHIATGLLAWQVLRRILDTDARLASRSKIVATTLVALWWLHPYNVSTVLYAVQRMTQIATLCCLAGMWWYLSIRQRIESGERAWHWVALFVGIPALTLLGIQGKQSAIVLPGLCLVLELGCFRREGRSPRQLYLFYALLLAMPAATLIGVLFLRPSWLLNGFSEYDFTVGQRLLSEGRVLLDYVRMLVLPVTPRMGIYTDDYVMSTGWLAPVSTLMAWLALATISVSAWFGRTRWPSFFTGWFLFLAAHSVEASILPIELYYEHRNYLPSIGLFLALASIVIAFADRLDSTGVRMGRVGGAALLALVAMLALQTHGRARVWSDRFVLAESELAAHPESIRAVLNYAALAKDAGDPGRAIEVMDQTVLNANDDRLRGLSRLVRLRFRCELEHVGNVEELRTGFDELPIRIDLSTVQVLGFSSYLDPKTGGCANVGLRDYADALSRFVDRAVDQPDTTFGKWALRFHAAKIYAELGEWKDAERVGRLAWQPTASSVVATPLITALLTEGNTRDARQVLVEAEDRVDMRSKSERDGVRDLRRLVEKAGRAPDR